MDIANRAPKAVNKEFKKNMKETRGVIEAILEDELADFDPEDFKRIEKLARERYGCGMVFARTC